MEIGLALLVGAAALRYAKAGGVAADGQTTSDVPAPKVMSANARRQTAYLEADPRQYHYAREDRVSRVSRKRLDFETRINAIWPDHSQRYHFTVDPAEVDEDHDALRDHFTRTGLMTDTPVHAFKNRQSDKGIPNEGTRILPEKPFIRQIYA